MELICTEKYNDIRFTLNVGDSTAKIPYLTDLELRKLLVDYPQKFREIKSQKASEDLAIEQKIPMVETRKVKLTKK